MNKVSKDLPELRLDIYVEGKEQTNTNIVIIIDSRESSSQVVNELRRYNIKLQFRQLKVGDFLLSERVVVERKTPNDFSTSIIDGRLFNQATSLKCSYEKPIILVQGMTLYTDRNIKPQSVMGAISSLLLDYEIPLVWTENPEETALLLYSIARREQLVEKRVPRIRAEKKPIDLKKVQEYVVAGLPNIDTVLAKRLLKSFGTVQKVFLATEKQLQNIEGIGEKKSRSIREMIMAYYESDS